jgi:hypothetical protein
MAVKVKTYKNAKDYEKDAAKMLEDGWQIQGQSSSQGRVRMGRTIVKGAVLLPWAIMRPSRKGEKMTVTWIKEESPSL